jgi:hypothetical protein
MCLSAAVAVVASSLILWVAAVAVVEHLRKAMLLALTSHFLLVVAVAYLCEAFAQVRQAAWEVVAAQQEEAQKAVEELVRVLHPSHVAACA